MGAARRSSAGDRVSGVGVRTGLTTFDVARVFKLSDPDARGVILRAPGCSVDRWGNVLLPSLHYRGRLTSWIEGTLVSATLVASIFDYLGHKIDRTRVEYDEF